MANQPILNALALLLVSGLGATAAVEYEGYTNPAGNAFPIAIYDNVLISTPDCKQILSDAEQKAYFDTIRMAGFNVELWGKEDIWRKEPMNKWGPYLKSIGMNTIISTRGFTLTRSETPYDANTPDSILLHPNWNGLRTVITNYNQDPNVWGYWVSDEPTVRSWTLPVYELNKDEGAVIPTFDMVNKYKGDKVAFANFVAKSDQAYIGHFATETPGQHYIRNFENYLDYMVDLLDLKFLTFDLYPVISGSDSIWKIKAEYYNMMDLYGRYCRDRKIPVWLIMLSVEHSCYYDDGSLYWQYPKITEGFLRMQAMNGLAFGMKGLIYWEYGTTGIKDENNNIWYKSALYDINKMQKTPAWESARNINCEISQYGAVLQKATYDRSCLALTEPSQSYQGFKKMSGSFECVDSVKYNYNDKTIECGPGVMLSHLTCDDWNYMAVVSQDYVNRQPIILYFDKNIINKRIIMTYWVDNVNNVDNTDISDNPFSGEYNVGSTVRLTLEPGGMALFKYRYRN